MVAVGVVLLPVPAVGTHLLDAVLSHPAQLVLGLGGVGIALGDIAECYADPTKAKNELGWVAEYGIEEMCADSWNWQKNNPDGYHTVK